VPVTIAVVRNECSIGSDVSPEFSNRFQQFSLLLAILFERECKTGVFQLGTGQLCWLRRKRVRLNMCRQLVRKIADLSLSSLLQRSAKDEAFRGQILAQARAAGSTEEAAGWLKLISEIGTGNHRDRSIID
jgi:hypothetical protein